MQGKAAVRGWEGGDTSDKRGCDPWERFEEEEGARGRNSGCLKWPLLGGPA